MPQSCPSCRASVNPTDAFCPNCGYTLRASSQQPTVPYQPVAQPRQSPGGYHPQSRQARQRSRPWFRKKRFIFPLVFLLLLGATGAGAMWYINNAFGWYYLTIMAILLILVIVIIFSPYGKIRLGRDSDQGAVDRQGSRGCRRMVGGEWILVMGCRPGDAI